MSLDFDNFIRLNELESNYPYKRKCVNLNIEFKDKNELDNYINSKDFVKQIVHYYGHIIPFLFEANINKEKYFFHIKVYNDKGINEWKEKVKEYLEGNK